MTPIRYPLDFTPWKLQRFIGFAGDWAPFTPPEARAVLTTDVAIMKAYIASALAQQQRGAHRG